MAEPVEAPLTFEEFASLKTAGDTLTSELFPGLAIPLGRLFR